MTICFQALESVADFADLPEQDSERHALLWKMTDFFLASAEHCEEGDRDFFGELLEEMAYSLERQVREQLARRIAAEQLMPRRLILRLANDNIPVARPVLEQSPVLTDSDLIEISRNRGQDHMLAISHRREISLRVSAVLAERGNEDVVHSLLQNPGAKFAPDTIDLLAGRSRACERIGAAFVQREDVPKEVLLDLLKHASEKVRADIRDRLSSADGFYLDQVVSEMESDIEVSKKSLARERIDELEQREALNEQAILGFLREKMPMEFLLGLARLFAIDVRFARRVISDRTGQALVVACRANRISLKGVKKMASSPMTAMPSDPHALLSITKWYQRITEESAQRTMRMLRLRDNMLAE